MPLLPGLPPASPRAKAQERAFSLKLRGTCEAPQPPSPAQVLLELVHFARKSVSPKELGHCIHILAGVSASSGLPAGVHLTCVRVMLGMTESVFPVSKQPGGCGGGQLCGVPGVGGVGWEPSSAAHGRGGRRNGVLAGSLLVEGD